jgi:hypothetical protein
MSQESQPLYEFPEDVPLNPIEPGTNLLVMEPSVGGTQKTALKLLDGEEDEGVLFITTSNSGRETIDLFEDCGGRYSKNRMAVIDCSEGGRESAPLNIRTVSSLRDITGIGILFSSLYEQLHGSQILQVRTGFYSLSTLLTYVEDFRPIFRFLHTITGRITTADGLGLFALDPETQDDKTIKSLSQPFDGRVDVRRSDDEYELRIRGLDDQPDGWHTVSFPESD